MNTNANTKEAKGGCGVERDVRRGVVCIQSWGGYSEKPCRIVGETPQKYRIEVDEKIWLPGHFWLEPGQKRLVPITAVRFLTA